MGSKIKKIDTTDGFTKITYKRRTTRSQCTVPDSLISDTEVDIARFGTKLARTVYELQRSAYMKDFEEILGNIASKFGTKINFPSQLTSVLNLADGLKNYMSLDSALNLDIVCYGLGRFLTSDAARTQLALLFILGVAHCGNVFVYDPVFSEKEKEILRMLSLNVLSVNEEGKRSICKPTLFFMPYCPHELYNNLLWANWSLEKLSKLVIVGNSFKVIADDIPKKYLMEDNRYLYEAVQFTKEVVLPASAYSYFYGFSIHTFDSNKMQDLPDVIWQMTEEPEYTFTEIIKNQ